MFNSRNDSNHITDANNNNINSDKQQVNLNYKSREKIYEKLRTKHDGITSCNNSNTQNTHLQKQLKTEHYHQNHLQNDFNNNESGLEMQSLHNNIYKHQVDGDRMHQHQLDTQTKSMKLSEHDERFINKQPSNVKYLQENTRLDQNNNNIWNNSFNANDNDSSSFQKIKMNDNLFNGNINNNNKFSSFLQQKKLSDSLNNHQQQKKIPTVQSFGATVENTNIVQNTTDITQLIKQQQQQQLYNMAMAQSLFLDNKMLSSLKSNHLYPSSNEFKKNQQIEAYSDMNQAIDFSSSNSTQSHLLSNANRECLKQKHVFNSEQNNEEYSSQVKKIKFSNDTEHEQSVCHKEMPNPKTNNNENNILKQQIIETSNLNHKLHAEERNRNIYPVLESSHPTMSTKTESSTYSKLNEINEETPIDSLNLKQHVNKQKPKPMPLKIPSNISTLHYPNLTLLKSPHFNFETKLQYTPPPMLSPFRKAPGLYFNTKQFLTAFSVPCRPPILPSANSLITSSQSHENVALNTSDNTCNSQLLSSCSFKTESFTPQLSTPKPSLLRSRISSVTGSTSSFFPDEIPESANGDGEEKTKP